jgi:hypothetical protein
MRPALTAALVALLAVGAFFVWWAGTRADRQMRDDLLGRAQLAAGAVNPERVKTLAGTEADLTLPAYLRLKQQFAASGSNRNRAKAPRSFSPWRRLRQSARLQRAARTRGRFGTRCILTPGSGQVHIPVSEIQARLALGEELQHEPENGWSGQ